MESKEKLNDKENKDQGPKKIEQILTEAMFTQQEVDLMVNGQFSPLMIIEKVRGDNKISISYIKPNGELGEVITVDLSDIKDVKIAESVLKIEKKPEHIPTCEEIHKIFRKLIKAGYKEVRHIGDAEGPYILEVAIPGEKEGETTQYEYIRAGEYKEGASLATEIHKVYYEKGIPVGGELVAKFVDGK